MLKIDFDGSFEVKYESSGLFIAQDEWIHPRRVIDSNEIIFVRSGVVYFQEEDRQYILKPGNVFLVKPHILHFGYEKSDIDKETSFYLLHFKGSDFNTLGFEESVFKVEDIYMLSDLFKKLLHFSINVEFPKYTAELYTALIICTLLAENKRTKTENKHPALVKNVSEWIRINSDDRCLSIADISAYFGYNGEYLSRLFKSSFNISLKEYIVKEKLKRAKKLLTDTVFSQKEISVKLGFSTPSGFINFFRYHEGITPTQYRNRFSNTHWNKQ